MSKLIKFCCPECLEDVNPIYDRKCILCDNDVIKTEVSASCPNCYFSTGYYNTVFDCAMAWNNDENRKKNLDRLTQYEESISESLAKEER